MNTLELKNRLGGPIHIDQETIDGFSRKLRGSLLLKEHRDYEMARKVWNGSIDKKPAMIVRCQGTADVMASVDFVRDHGLLFSVRAGGHNVSGASVNDGGVVIDVSQMRSVHVDPHARIARVEAGARLGDLDHETVAFDLAAPVGLVSETGVAGLTLHGGTGWLTRKHGLSIDNLHAIEIVTAEGKMLRTSVDEHPNLFWALCGGGGNFGVVTQFEFRLHPIGRQVSISMPIYAMENAREVMTACQKYMAAAPDDLMVLGVYWSGPPIPEVPKKHQGEPVVILLGCYTGLPEHAQEVISPLRTIGEPIADLSADMGWKDVQRLLDEDYPDGKYYYWKSIYLERLDDECMSVLEEYTRNRPSAESSIDVWFLGGASARVAQDATAFYNRRHPFMIGIEANWSAQTDSEANIAWARNLHTALKPFSSGGNYLNFPGYVEDIEEMLLGAYGENLQRLQSIKAAYDPDNLFPGLLNITPK
ncbi:MAG: FAD-binding oxidoreductase [Desulfobulbaceae bacterium]|nr:FAD-binding oxidoreductase [Desulfobulbaceae bacterium]